jgi:hypothetical protein
MKRNQFTCLERRRAVLLTAIMALAVSRVTTFASGIGILRCYDIKGALENCADQPPLIARTVIRHMRLD